MTSLEVEKRASKELRDTPGLTLKHLICPFGDLENAKTYNPVHMRYTKVLKVLVLLLGWNLTTLFLVCWFVIFSEIWTESVLDVKTFLSYIYFCTK